MPGLEAETAKSPIMTHSHRSIDSLPQRFKFYIENIDSDESFDIQQFESCSEADRDICVRILVEQAISQPFDISPVADVAKEILRTFSLKFSTQMKIVKDLRRIMNEEIEKLVDNNSPEQWKRTKCIGTFLSHLYIGQVQNSDLVIEWLKGVKKLATDEEAGKIILEILMMVIDKMKSSDEANFKVFLHYLRNLSMKGKVPAEFRRWSVIVLNRNTQVDPKADAENSFATMQSKFEALGRTQPTWSFDIKLNNIVSQLNFENYASVQSQLSALENADETYNEKVVKAIIAQTRKRPDLAPCAVEILLKLPQCNSAVNRDAFEEAIERELLKLFDDMFATKIEFDIEVTQLVNLVKKLHMRSAIKTRTIMNIVEHIAAKSEESFRIQFLLKFIKLNRDELLKSEIVLKNTESVLKSYAINTADNMKDELKNALQLFTSFQSDKCSTEFFSQSNETIAQLRSKPMDSPKSSSPTTEDQKLKSISDLIELGNHVTILSELASLGIIDGQGLFRELVKTLMFKVTKRCDLHPCIAEVLTRLPKVCKLSVTNGKLFRKQIRLEIELKIQNLLDVYNEAESHVLITFIGKLHGNFAIDDNIFVKIMRYLAKYARTDKKTIGFKFLAEFIKLNEWNLYRVKSWTGRKKVIREVVESMKTVLDKDISELAHIRRSLEDAYRILFLVLFRQPEMGDGSDYEYYCEADDNAHAIKMYHVESPTEINSYLNKQDDVDNFGNATIIVAPKFAPSSTIRKPVQPDLTQLKITSVLSNLKLMNLDDLRNLIKSFNHEDSVEVAKFVETFYNVTLTRGDCMAYAKLAVVVEHEMTSIQQTSGRLFKELLSKMVQTAIYTSLPFDCTNIAEKESEKLVLLVQLEAELYKLGWIDKDQLKRLTKSLADSNFPNQFKLKTFRLLLQTVELTLVKNGDGDLCEQLRRLIVTKFGTSQNLEDNLSKSEIIDIIENVEKLCKESARYKFDVKRFRSILFYLNINNLTEAIDQIKSLSIKSLADLDVMINLLIDKAINDPDDAANCAKLIFEVQEISIKTINDQTVSVKDALEAKCKKILMNNLKDGIKLHQLSITTGLLQFIGELYISKVFDFDFIVLCLELISKDINDENTIDCVSSFLRSFGAKTNSKDIQKLDEYFNKFQEIVEQENSYRSQILKSLIESRNHHWFQVDNDQS